MTDSTVHLDQLKEEGNAALAAATAATEKVVEEAIVPKARKRSNPTSRKRTVI